MDYQLKGKLAFVAAGAYGIGAATANLLTQEGASVIVADRDEAALRENGSGWTGTFAGDLSTAEGVNDTLSYVLKTFGRAPDILVNNLGVGDGGNFEDLSDERWLSSFNVNLLGTVRICRALLPKMAQLAGASVVNTDSDLAKQPEPTLMDYGSFKAGLLYLTKALAKQYVPKVRINAVCPGPVWTRMWSRPGGLADQISKSYGLPREEAIKKFLEDRYMPMGIGQPDDVAHAIVFLASPLAKFITGSTLDIGGTLRGLV
jgi:NAD(P)-dependent dehydrogenase (short-subunit alcohol dehydrogenase family)